MRRGSVGFIFFKIWKEKSGSDSSVKCQHVINVTFHQLHIQQLPENIKNDIWPDIYRVCSKIVERWKKCGRVEERLLNNNANWLKENVNLPHNVVMENVLPSTSGSGRKNSLLRKAVKDPNVEKPQNFVKTLDLKNYFMPLQLTTKGNEQSGVCYEKSC